MSTEAGPERSLRAVFTVTAETRKGAFYFDRDGFARSVASRIEGALEGLDDIRDVRIVEVEPVAPDPGKETVSARVAALREAADMAEEENRACKGTTPCLPCSARTTVAIRLRRMADRTGR